MPVRKRRPNGVKLNPVRSVRCDDVIWEKAKRRAAFENVTMSFVTTTLIQGYAEGKINLPRSLLVFEEEKAG